MEKLLPNRPSTYRELIKQSTLLYGKTFSRIFLLALLLSFIVFIPRIMMDIIGNDIFWRAPLFSWNRLFLVVINLAELLFFVAILWRMYCFIRHRHEPLKQDFKMGLQKVIAVFLATLIQSLIVFVVAFAILSFEFILYQFNLLFPENIVGSLVMVVFYLLQLFILLYIITLFLFIFPLIAIENDGIFVSLKHSASLVWNHWWRTFSVQITPWLCYMAALILFGFLILNIRTYFFNPHPLLTTLIHVLIFSLYIPWVAALLLVQLRDLELRKKLHHHHASK